MATRWRQIDGLCALKTYVLWMVVADTVWGTVFAGSITKNTENMGTLYMCTLNTPPRITESVSRGMLW